LWRAGGPAGEVHRQDRPSARSDERLDGFRIDVERLVDIGEHRRGTVENDRASRGKPGQRRRDDLVAGADAEALETEDQGVGAATDADTEPAAAEIGDPPLKFLHS